MSEAVQAGRDKYDESNFADIAEAEPQAGGEKNLDNAEAQKERSDLDKSLLAEMQISDKRMREQVLRIFGELAGKNRIRKHEQDADIYFGRSPDEFICDDQYEAERTVKIVRAMVFQSPDRVRYGMRKLHGRNDSIF